MASGGHRFTFSCQRCESILEAASGQTGQAGRCPTCGAVFTIPSTDAHTGLALGSAKVVDDGQLPTPVHAYATAGVKAPQIKRLQSGEQVIVCPRCARNMPVDANACSACGQPFTIEGAAQIAQSSGDAGPLAIAALTVGVLSIPMFCFPLPAAAAIVMGGLAVYRAASGTGPPAGKGMALAGLICGVVGLGAFMLWQWWK